MTLERRRVRHCLTGLRLRAALHRGAGLGSTSPATSTSPSTARPITLHGGRREARAWRHSLLASRRRHSRLRRRAARSSTRSPSPPTSTSSSTPTARRRRRSGSGSGASRAGRSPAASTTYQHGPDPATRSSRRSTLVTFTLDEEDDLTLVDVTRRARAGLRRRPRHQALLRPLQDRARRLPQVHQGHRRARPTASGTRR